MSRPVICAVNEYTARQEFISGNPVYTSPKDGQRYEMYYQDSDTVKQKCQKYTKEDFSSFDYVKSSNVHYYRVFKL